MRRSRALVITAERQFSKTIGAAIIRSEGSNSCMSVCSTSSAEQQYAVAVGLLNEYEISTILVGLSLNVCQRSETSGILLAQRLRREHGFKGSFVVISFLSQTQASKNNQFLTPGVPGVRYVRLPVSLSKLVSYLDVQTYLTPIQLQYVIRWHSGLQEDWHAKEHELVGSALRKWPEFRERSRKIVAEWGVTIREFAPDQAEALKKLEQALDGHEDEIRVAAQELARGLNIRPEVLSAAEDLPIASSSRAPQGFVAVLAADDHGLDHGVRSRLEAMGYVVEEADCLQKALNKLRFWRPAVVLADLHLGTRKDGLALMEEALKRNLLVIAISKAAVLEGQLPAGVEDCCGKWFQDTDRIHRIVWKYAHKRRTMQLSDRQ